MKLIKSPTIRMHAAMFAELEKRIEKTPAIEGLKDLICKSMPCMGLTALSFCFVRDNKTFEFLLTDEFNPSNYGEINYHLFNIRYAAYPLDGGFPRPATGCYWLHGDFMEEAGVRMADLIMEYYLEGKMATEQDLTVRFKYDKAPKHRQANVVTSMHA